MLIREGDQPLGPGAQAAVQSQAAQPVVIPGPGKVYRVDHRRLHLGLL